MHPGFLLFPGQDEKEGLREHEQVTDVGTIGIVNYHALCPRRSWELPERRLLVG